MNKKNFCDNICKAVEKFSLDLKGKVVLTEAASGNYACTVLSAALSGAKVYAYAQNSKYGLVEEVIKHNVSLLDILGCRKRVSFIEDLEEIDLLSVNILTNTGFLRPIKRELIMRLSSKCVIPLMWEPWEFRDKDIDLEACLEKGIKIYGTNEDDSKVNTKHYIGYTILHFLLERKMTPFSSKILVLGNKEFEHGISAVLKNNNYEFDYVWDYSQIPSIQGYSAIVLSEVCNNTLLIGKKNARIDISEISDEVFVLHIAGNVEFDGASFYFCPQPPRVFPYMSYTTDFVDPLAVIDLHSAALKVSEGMLVANNMNLKGKDYKDFLESNYPALSFEKKELW